MPTETYKYEEIPLMTDEYVVSYFDEKSKSDNIDRNLKTRSIVLTNRRIIETDIVGPYRNYTFGDLRDYHTISLNKRKKSLTPLFRASLLIFTTIVSLLVLPLSLPVYAMAILFVTGSTYHFIRFIRSPNESQITIRSTTTNVEMTFPSSQEHAAYIFVNNFFEIRAYLLNNMNYTNRIGVPKSDEVTVTNTETLLYNQSHAPNKSDELPVCETVVDQNTPSEKQGF